MEEALEFVGTDVDYRKRDEGEKEVGDELCCGHPSGGGHGIWNVRFERRGEGKEADIETFTADPGLECVPY